MPGDFAPWGRRRLLQAGAGALVGVGTGWAGRAAVPSVRTDGTTTPVTSSPPPGNLVEPFHGPHQAGVATPPQAHLSMVGLDLRDGVGPVGLGRLMTLLSDDASRLTGGRAALADTEAELAVHPARLTATFGFGPRVVGAMLRGVTLRPLPAFRTDRLDDAWGQTDVVVQLCADDPVTLAHTRRMLLKDAAPLTRVRWIQDGFRRARGTEADGVAMRNVLGQVDGTVNPVEAEPDFARQVWCGGTLAGGTFMVVRRIRALMTTWDKVDRAGREAAVGRRLDNGAPLTGRSEHDQPDFAARDRLGFPVIDPASHVARAHSTDPAERFLRRPYNYTVPDPSRPTGEDAGLVFVAFAADVERQFVPVQRRLATLDRLNQWVRTIGSAVYAVPPGAAEGEYVGERWVAA